MSNDSMEQRARELLAKVHAEAGWPGCEKEILQGAATFDVDHGLAMAAICAALKPQWQPIESAPKGQEVLVWRPDQGVFIAMIATPDMVMSESDIEECCLPEDFEEWYCEAWGWLEEDLRPTRWIPKPAEPEAV